MGAPLGTITNSVGTVSTGQVITANNWNTAVGGIYTYINSALLAQGFNLLNNAGDFLVHNGTNMQALGVGTNGFVLTADSTQTLGMKWAAQAASQLTTNGDLLYYNGGLARLGIGTTGQNLSVVSGLPAWSSNTPFGVVPVGGIILWNSTIASIPANFQVCDGTNGTPNLQGLYVVGAGATSPAASGGMGLINPGGPFGDNSAGAGVGPAHAHTTGTSGAQTGSGGNFNYNSGSTNSVTVTPRYQALCYIQRMT